MYPGYVGGSKKTGLYSSPEESKDIGANVHMEYNV